MVPEDMALNFHELPVDLSLSQTKQMVSLHIKREVTMRVTKTNTWRRRIAPLILNPVTGGGMWSA
jgi:hypothetical protein